MLGSFEVTSYPLSSNDTVSNNWSQPLCDTFNSTCAPQIMAKYFSDYNFILIYPIHTIAEESENRDLLNASLLPNFNKFEGIGKSISKALKAK